MKTERDETEQGSGDHVRLILKWQIEQQSLWESIQDIINEKLHEAFDPGGGMTIE